MVWQPRLRLLPLLIPALALRAVAADAMDCPAADAERTILDCTLVIEDPATNGNDSAMAYFNRGRAFLAEHKTDSAISDLTRAISINGQGLLELAGFGAQRLDLVGGRLAEEWLY